MFSIDIDQVSMAIYIIIDLLSIHVWKPPETEARLERGVDKILPQQKKQTTKFYNIHLCFLIKSIYNAVSVKSGTIK